MHRILAAAALLASLCASAAPIDFAGFPVDQQGYDAFIRSFPASCFARDKVATCTGLATVEGLQVPTIVLWRQGKSGARLFGYGTADLPCDHAAIKHLTASWVARWGKPRERPLEGCKSMWDWRDALGNRASFSNRPDSGRTTCTLLVEGGKWTAEQALS